LSERSSAHRYEVGALFGAAVAKKCEKVNVALFASTSMPFNPLRTEGVLHYVNRVGQQLGSIGYGTMIWQSVNEHYAGHDRVIIMTDEQGHDTHVQGTLIPNIHIVNLAGYKTATAPSKKGIYTYGGFTDAMFNMIPILEAGGEGRWPWA
jgi:hypothetical protein